MGTSTPCRRWRRSPAFNTVDTMWNHDGQPGGAVTVLDGTTAESTVFVGSVSGLLDVPAGVTVDIHGVLEDAVVSGPGTVRISGLLADVFRTGPGEVLASVGSVLAPTEPDGPWRVLGPCGTWATSDTLVFPAAALDVAAGSEGPAAGVEDPAAGPGETGSGPDLPWYPVPRS
jgi:hypothetical protein